MRFNYIPYLDTYNYMYMLTMYPRYMFLNIMYEIDTWYIRLILDTYKRYMKLKLDHINRYMKLILGHINR